MALVKDWKAPVCVLSDSLLSAQPQNDWHPRSWRHPTYVGKRTAIPHRWPSFEFSQSQRQPESTRDPVTFVGLGVSTAPQQRTQAMGLATALFKARKVWVQLIAAPRAPGLCGGQAAGRRQSQQTCFIPFLRLSSNSLFAAFSLPCSCFPLCWIVNGWGHVWSCPLLCNPQFLAKIGTLVGSLVSLLKGLLWRLWEQPAPRRPLSLGTLYLCTEKEPISSSFQPCNPRTSQMQGHGSLGYLWPFIMGFIINLLVSPPTSQFKQNLRFN